MIIELVTVDRATGAPGDVLDTAELAEDGSVLSGGERIRELIAVKTQSMRGALAAMETLRSWGNGYVLTREATDAPVSD